MSSTTEILCPLCHGRGREHKEVLVIRWRSRDFEQALQDVADEAAFGMAGGLVNPFEAEKPALSTK